MEPTPTQRDIINENGNTVVLASPGSGKTFVMSEKIKRFLKGDGLRDYQGVIAISYTRKASNHLKRKTLSDGIWEKNSFFGTIDSFCLTQIILPFGSFVFGHTVDEVLPVTENDIPKERRVDFEWINKDHPDYDSIGEITWQKLYDLFREGKVLIDSLELLALRIIKKCKACRLHLHARFKYVFIDEYQDADTYTNAILNELIEIGMVGNVVGDVNQSIFGFAHKKSEYLEALETRPGFKPYKLNDNFRCSNPIVNYSNRLLDAKCELIETVDEGVELIKVNGDEVAVANYLADYIDDDCKKWEVDDKSQVAVLVRSNKTQTYIDNNLSVPHRVVASTPLDDDVNPRSRLYAQLLQYYFDNKMPFLSVVDEYADYEIFTGIVRKKLLELRKEIRKVEEKDVADRFPGLFKEVADILLSKYQEGSALQHLKNVLDSTPMTDSYRPFNKDEVVIMTLHKAKGLEFDIVYHLNMNEFEIPFKSYNNGAEEYPNELQDLDLHYVGITRAKKLCVLITSTLRHNSKDEKKKGDPSIFLYRNGVENLRKDYKYNF